MAPRLRLSTIESRRPADRGRSREFAPRAASGPRRRGTGGGGHRAKRRVLAYSCLDIVAAVIHDVYDALTAALSSFMDRRPRFCRRVTGRLVGAHPRALGGASGRARRRVVVLSALKYILCIHTRPTVAWGPPPGAYRARAGSRTILVVSDTTSVGKGLRGMC